MKVDLSSRDVKDTEIVTLKILDTIILSDISVENESGKSKKTSSSI